MTTDDSFLHRTTRDLLDLFAAGRNTPGAGSAAALTGALAGSVLQTVARHTIKAAEGSKRREVYAPFHERAEAILEETRNRSRSLRGAVDADATAFDRFWQDRTEENLQHATDIPIEIAGHCAALAEIGLELHERGFRNAQGEAAAATLSAISSGETAAYIAHLNLRSAGVWAEERKAKISHLRRRLRELRGLIEARIYEPGESAMLPST
jgi:formiminotetrahydrofolate cyclodeaminase